jgi:N-methylhydantoinase A
MPRVVIPPLPGNFSAFGLLAADVRHDYVRTRLVPTRGLGFEELGAVFAELRDEARLRLGTEGFAPEATRFEARLDMRYVGQAFELSVPVQDGWRSMADVDAAFYAAHEQRYAHAVEDPVEIVSFRLSAYGVTTKPALPGAPGGPTSLAAARPGVRPVFFDDGFVDTPVYARDRLPAAARVRGPALVEEPGTTTLIPPGFHAAVGELGVLVLERE